MTNQVGKETKSISHKGDSGPSLFISFLSIKSLDFLDPEPELSLSCLQFYLCLADLACLSQLTIVLP